ncbi:MAG TPA: NAD(P)-dependent oxidoreductase [Candidatus Limnocylindrales bacterium]|nr:NAD(P)-dependent oxidoreductase [Candidatus Limnocylindrales bacterium]
MKKRVGFIGLGVMGRPMARNILKAGFPLTVYNRTQEKTRELVSSGAIAVNSPRAVGENADVVITMVSDSPDVKEVILGDQGVLQGAKKGTIIIDMSTISPMVSKEIAEQVKARGCYLLDAPVVGSKKAAEEASLGIMVGGDRKIFEDCLEIFQAMGKKITYMGGQGMGAYTKMCIQLMVGATMEAVAECLALGAKAGLNLNDLKECTLAGGAKTGNMEMRGPKIINRDFETHFALKHMCKDLKLVLATGDELGVPLPLAATALEMFKAARALGHGEEDVSSVIHAIEALAGIRVGGHQNNQL